MGRIIKIVCLSILFLLFSEKGYTNMASPHIRGSNISEAYSSKDIDIISEHISVFFINFHQVQFTVTYNIKTDREGKQIPLIFDTMTDRYIDNSDFKVWIDDIEIPTLKIPSTYEDANALQWIDSLDRHLSYPKNNVPNIIGLKYFEADIAAGEHTIRVQYTAVANTFLGNKVTEYNINYNLKPARYWRSFGTLDIEINTNNLQGTFTSDLSGKESEIKENITHWHFNKLPQDDFSIEYKPNISTLGKIAIAISPEGFSFIFIAIFIFFHIRYILKYREKNRAKRFSPVVFVGGVLIPLIYCFIFMFCYSLVDIFIGEHATGRHGYIFLIFLLFPFLAIGYTLISFIIDSYKKYRLQKKSNL